MKQYYLATTGISEIWDLTADKILLLGPWCAISPKNRKLLEGKDIVAIPSPWKPTQKVKEAADYCYMIYHQILPQLAENLNRIHHVTYPVKYRQILLGPWLLMFIEIFYDRYMRIANSVKLFPSLVTHTLA